MRAALHLDHVDAWKDLRRNFSSKPLPRVVSQRRMVAVRQHAVHDAPLIKRRAEGLGHVREVLPHLLGVDAAHEPVVLDLDGRDRGLVEQLAEHDEPVLEEGVALRRRQVRRACYSDDDAGAQHHVAVAAEQSMRRGAGQR